MGWLIFWLTLEVINAALLGIDISLGRFWWAAYELLMVIYCTGWAYYYVRNSNR